MRYTRGKWRVTNPKVWLFSSVLILGWRIVPTVAQASEAETVTMSSHSVQLETDSQDQLTEVARISKTAVTRDRHSVTAQSSKIKQLLNNRQVTQQQLLRVPVLIRRQPQQVLIRRQQPTQLALIMRLIWPVQLAH